MREVRLFASARKEPRARRFIDAITALTALVLLSVLGLVGHADRATSSRR